MTGTGERPGKKCSAPGQIAPFSRSDYYIVRFNGSLAVRVESKSLGGIVSKILGKFVFIIVLAPFFLSACHSSNKANGDGGNGPVEETKVYGGAQMTYTVLPNGIRVLLVSSPKATDNVVAVSVASGSFSDPADHPGIAHFVEHTLFLGNKENPGPAEYMNFVSANNGQHNAHTGGTMTSFFLQMTPDVFPEGVRRISRFFVAPLFDETLVNNEKNIIDQEYSLRTNSDQETRASSAFYPRGSIARKFTVGNNESLASATAADARKFFEEHYVPSQMTLVIYGPQSNADLKALAVQNFSDVPERTPPTPIDYDTAYKPSIAQMNAIMKVQNSKLPNSLDLTFYVDSDKFTENQRTVIGSVLGDEGPGSLLSVLQADGLANPQKGALSAGASGDSINLSIQLTPDGVANYDAVIGYAKGYIDFMKANALPEDIAKKAIAMRKAGMLEKTYDQLDLDGVVGLAEDLRWQANWKDVFEANDMTVPTNADYQAFLNNVKMDNYYGVLTDNSVDVNQASLGQSQFAFSDFEHLDDVTVDGQKYLLDGWYGAAYAYLPAALSSIATQTDASFALPPSNPFTPGAFTMFNQPITGADLLPAALNAQIQVNQGAGVSIPKTYFTAFIVPTALNKNDKKQMSLFILMKNWVLASMRQDVYILTDVGYESNLAIYPATGAIQLSFNGWSDQYVPAISDFISKIHMSSDEVAFQQYKKQSIQVLMQQAANPNSAIGDAFNTEYMPNYPTKADQIAAYQGASLADIQKMYNDTFKEFYFRGVLSGNLQASMAPAILNAINTKFPQANKLDDQNLPNLEQASNGTVSGSVVFNLNVGANNPNSSVRDFFQFGYSSKREYNMALILAQWVNQPFFDELRTHQQVAYTPYVQFTLMGQYYGVDFVVDSDSNGAEDIAQRVNAFITSWVANDLPKKTQDDVDVWIDRLKQAAAADKADTTHDTVVNNTLFPQDKYADEDQQYNITVQDVVEFATKKLVESPEGVLIKVKSVNDAPAQPAAKKAIVVGVK